MRLKLLSVRFIWIPATLPPNRSLQRISTGKLTRLSRSVPTRTRKAASKNSRKRSAVRHRTMRPFQRSAPITTSVSKWRSLSASIKSPKVKDRTNKKPSKQPQKQDLHRCDGDSFATIETMLKRLEIVGFKSFPKKTVLDFVSATTAIVGPNGSGESNVAEAFRFALGEQSMKSRRGKRAEDLIWGGSHTVPRASRAAVVIIFDNSPHGGHRPFKIDFDEVAIERAVFRDGASEYSINGSRVRLRDIEELLAGANIGETEHHIISQGEADRILLANTRARREELG